MYGLHPDKHYALGKFLSKGKATQPGGLVNRLAQELHAAKTKPSVNLASNGVVKTNNIPGSPRFGRTYVEASIGGRTVHRYALDGSEDIVADTAAFRPNTTPLQRPAASRPSVSPPRTSKPKASGYDKPAAKIKAKPAKSSAGMKQTSAKPKVATKSTAIKSSTGIKA